MSLRYTISEKEPISSTRVFSVLEQSELERPWAGRDVWAYQEGSRWVCRCTACSSTMVAMLSSCAHARAVQRHLTAKEPLEPAPKASEPQDSSPGREPWYAGYLLGQIRTGTSTPPEHLDTCAQWKGGPTCTLRLFADNAPVRPEDLAKDAIEALTRLKAKGLDTAEAELQALASWAEAQHKVCIAAQELSKAVAIYRDCASAADLSPEDRIQVRLLALNPLR